MHPDPEHAGVAQPAGSDPAIRSLYALYGVSLASSFSFTTPLPRSALPPDVSFECTAEAPTSVAWIDREPVFRSSILLSDGRPEVTLHEADGFQVLRHTGIADHYVWPDRIVSHRPTEKEDALVEIDLLGLVLSFWLEGRGTRVLHAAAAATSHGAAVFLATNTGGKTSLAYSLMLGGAGLLSDDLVAVDSAVDPPIAYPAFPQARMWPDLARHFLPDEPDLPRVWRGTDKVRVPIGGACPGRFHPHPSPIRAFYLPARRDRSDRSSGTRLEPISPPNAVVELVRESFLTTILEKTGLHGRRFADLSSIASRVPMFRLSYPNGFSDLPRVREAVLTHLGGLS